MRKEDNDWSVTVEYEQQPKRDEVNREVTINGVNYLVNENTACLCHAMMLLVDAVNDKK